MQRIGEINGVDDTIARQDIAEMRTEIQRYHQLDIATQHDGCYLLEGSHLNQRLCLLHWLRRALRLCPHFIAQQFTPSLKIALKQLGIARTLYDDTNLRALVNFCSRRLQRQFECRDAQFYSSICSTACSSTSWARVRRFQRFSATGPSRAASI